MSRDINMCHPRLRELAERLTAECRRAGLDIKITDCVRNAREQAECVRRGTSGLYYPNSHHNWGTAFDFCRNDGRGAYDDSDGFFSRVGAVGESLGLEWGGRWKKPVDKPHFQLPDWGSTTAGLKAIYGTPDKFMDVWTDEEETMVRETRYNTVEEIPEWGRATIQQMIDDRCFADPKELDISEDMLRVFVVMERKEKCKK